MNKLHIIPTVLIITALTSCDSDHISCLPDLFPMEIEYIKNKEYDINNVGIKVFLGLFSRERKDNNNLNATLTANDIVLKTYTDDDLRDIKFVYDIYQENNKSNYFFRGNEYIKIPKSAFTSEEGAMSIKFTFLIDKDGVLTPTSSKGMSFWYEKRPNAKIRFSEKK